MITTKAQLGNDSVFSNLPSREKRARSGKGITLSRAWPAPPGLPDCIDFVGAGHARDKYFSIVLVSSQGWAEPEVITPPIPARKPSSIKAMAPQALLPGCSINFKVRGRQNSSAGDDLGNGLTSSEINQPEAGGFQVDGPRTRSGPASLGEQFITNAQLGKSLR